MINITTLIYKFRYLDKKKVLLVIALLLVAVVIVILPKYFFLTDEDLIKRQIHIGAKSVEKKDIEKLSDLFSENYEGDYASSKNEAIQNAENDFRRLEDINIKFESINITFNTDSTEARVVCEFYVSGVFTGSGIYNKIPFKGLANPYGKKPDKATLVMQKETDGEWRITFVTISIPSVMR